MEKDRPSVINRLFACGVALSCLLWSGSAEAYHCRLGKIWLVHSHTCVQKGHLVTEPYTRTRVHARSLLSRALHRRRHGRSTQYVMREEDDQYVRHHHRYRRSRRKTQQKEDVMHGDPIEDRVVDEPKAPEPKTPEPAPEPTDPVTGLLTLPDAFAKSIMKTRKPPADWGF